MFIEILTPLTFLKTATTIAVAIIGCMAGLHKTIKKVYDLYLVKVFTVFVIAGGFTLFCIVSVTGSFGSIAFLEIAHRLEQIKLESRIVKLKTGLDSAYKDLGRSVYNRQQPDELMSRVMMLNTQVAEKLNESNELVEIFKNKVRFENILRDLHSAKITVRLEAVRNLGTIESSYSAPYLKLCAIDTNQAVRTAAEEAMGMLGSQQYITPPDPYAVYGGTAAAIPAAGQEQAGAPVVPGSPLNKDNGGDF